MAEVLITLGIIGVVAALTLPSLMKYSRKTEIETRLKRVYTTMNQAVTMSIANDTWTKPPMDNRSDDVVLKKWMETAVFPYLKNYELIEPDTVNYPSNVDLRNIPGIRFSDGSILLYHNNQQVHMWVDVNGFKGPNKAGRDLFYFFLDYNNIGRGYFYPSGYAYSNNGNEDENPVDNYVYNDREGMKKYCAGKNVYLQDSNTCALLIMNDGWQIKDDYPASY